MELLLFLTVTLAVALPAASAHDPWNTDYSSRRGPLYWGEDFEMCGKGKEQSPINIRRSTTTYVPFPKLAFDSPQRMIPSQIQNKGTSAAAYPLYPNIPTLSGGPLGEDSYRVYNVHMHFGNYSYPAAEHAFDGVRTTGELHIVTYDSKYPNIKSALKSGRKGALAVLGIMFEARNVSNIDAGVTNLIELASNLTYKGEHYHTNLSFVDLVSPTDMKYYYVYNGSLTTPSCSEVVTWMVIDRIHYVTPETIEMLADMRSGYKAELDSLPIRGNTRPLQSLNGRRVLRSFAPIITDLFDQDSSASHSIYSCFAIIASVLIAMVTKY